MTGEKPNQGNPEDVNVSETPLSSGDLSGIVPDSSSGQIISGLPGLTSSVEQQVEDADDGDAPAMHDLEAQGFTEDEAVRLIHVSDRLKTSREAREAEAVLRRLQFNRWLIQEGMLDEWNV